MAFDPTSAVLDDDAAPASSSFDPSTAIMDEDADQGVLGTLWEGTKSAGRALGATANTYTGNAEGVINKAATQQEAPKDYRLEGFHEDFRKNVEAAGEDPGVLDSIGAVGKAVIDNPAGAGLAVVEQLPNSVPTLAGGYAGLKGGAALGGMVGGPLGATVGGVIGGLAGMFLGNASIETGHKAMAAADDGDYTPEEMAQVKREGAVKGGVITAVDAATLGVGGKVAGAMQRTTATALETATRKALVDRGVDVADEAAVLAARQSPEISAAVRAAQDSAVKATDTLRRRAAEAGTLMSMETVGEGLGEYLGELAATGEGNIPDAVLESLLSVGQSGAETAWNMGRKREQGGQWEVAEPATELAAEQGMPAAPEMVQPLASDANPNPAPVPLPDPASGPLSAAASLLPAAAPTADRQQVPSGVGATVEPGTPAAQAAGAEQGTPVVDASTDAAGREAPLETVPSAEATKPGEDATRPGEPAPAVLPAVEQPTEPPATPSQRAILKRRGVGDEQLATMTRKQAGELLRRQNGTGPETQARPPAAPQQLSLEAGQPTEASLRDELSYLERQARASGGWSPALTRERARIRTALEPFEQATLKPAETVDAPQDTGTPGQAAPSAQTSLLQEPAAAQPQSAPADVASAAPITEGSQQDVPASEAQAPEQQITQPSIEGKSIGDGWSEFAPESGTLRIPRAEMPQIRAEHRGAMVNFLNARGVQHQEEAVPAADLKPTQAEFSRDKVKQAAEYTGGNRSILVSRDGHVLDGHHQWMAAREKGEEVKVIRLDAPIRDLVQAAHEFPSSTTEQAAESAPAQEPSEKAPAGKQKKPRGVLAKKAEAEAKARGEYFAPGNIVAGYGGHDRVIAYSPPDAEGNWSVTVRAVQKQGDTWVDAPDQRERTHMTAPSSRELKMGPVERVIAEQQPASQTPASPETATSQAAAQAVEAYAGAGSAHQRNPAARIEDAGEKLGGARKDELRGVRERLESMDDAAIASSKLSELWPKGEIDRIEDRFHAAAYQTVRGYIPAKPRAEYRVRSWVGKVKAARELIAELSDMGSDASLAKLREFSPGLRLVADKIEALMGLDRSQWDRIGNVSINQGRYNQGGEMVPGSWVSVEIDKRANSFYGHDSIASALPSLKEFLEGRAAPEKKMKFSIFSDRRTDDVFITQDSDKERRPLKRFSELKAARAYLADHHNDLVAAWEAVKNRDNVTRADMRRATNAKRVGRDYRDGTDITPEQFLEAFGFRGVEFGNWVKQGADGKERQGMLNEAYDAFMDLADIVGVPSKALSLEGRLGIGFGSRGRGKASAHFEPGSVVINLTKTKGAGSLAHEWFHALDNYFSGKREASDSRMARETAYITYRPEPMLINTRYPSQRLTRAKLDMYQANHPGAALYAEENWAPDPNHPKGVRQQVEKAFAELVETLDRSPMTQRAAVLDKGAVDGYWSRIIERGARAFETYVIAKLADRGARNDYLANVQTLEQFVRDPGRYPYLTPDEQGPVNEAFDKLFSTIDNRNEPDGSVALYSRGSYRQGRAEQGSKAVPLRLQLQRLTGGWQNAPKIKVVQSVAGLPDAQRRQVERDGAFDVEGMFADGQVYLVADNLRDAKHAAFVLQHEVLGHAGLQGAYGQRLTPLLTSLYNEHAPLREKADTLVQRFGYTSAVAMEEVLADMAADGTLREQTFWKRLVAAMRNVLRSIGMRVVWSDGDIQALLANARRYIVNGRRRPGARAAFSRDGRSGRGIELTDEQGRLLAPNGKPSRLGHRQWHQARSKNFKQWFGDWQAVATQERLDAMKPLRLRMPEAWKGMSEKDRLAAVTAALKGMAKAGEVLHHSEMGDIRMSMSGVKKATSSAADPAKKIVLARLRESFERSVYAGAELDQQGRPDVLAFHRLIMPIDLDGVPLAAIFTVRETSQGQFFYNTVTVARKDEAPAASPGEVSNAQITTPAFTGASASAVSPRDMTQEGQRSTAANTEVSSFVRQPLARVNPADVSKAIDRNGEPLVLYHGTGEEFTVFDQGRAGRSTGHSTSSLGIFLTRDADLAQSYAVKASDGMPGLANVMPLFASIKRPYRMSVAESQGLDTVAKVVAMRQRLENEGYDGIQLGDTGTWVALYNTQVKSATNNTGAFDEVDPDIRYSRASQRNFIGRQTPFELNARNAKRHLQGRLADLKPAMLGALPLMYLRDFAPRNMTALSAYIDAKRAMDADRNELHTRYDAISQRWLKLRWTDRKAEQRLADLMHAATLAGVDPSKPAKEDFTPEQKAEYNRLSLMYRSLPEGHRAMFSEVRDAYKGQVEGLEQVIEENIRKSGDYAIKRAKRDRDADIQQARDELTGDELDEAIEDADKRYQRRVAAARAGNSSKLLLLRKKFESMRVDEPYFPLKRFGEYFVAMRDGTKLVSFSMFERAADMEAAAEQLRKTYPGLDVSVGRQSNKQELAGAVDPTFVADLQELIAKLPNGDEVSEQMWQMYLETLPDYSMRKGFIHRKKTPGFDRDAMRAFASSMFHSSYQIARLKHSLEMNELVEQVEEQAKASADPVDAMTIANEMRKRHEWVMAPKGGKIAQHITSAAFVYQLGITPAAALVNMTQTWMMGIPVLGTRFGSEAKATAALTKASKDFVQGRGHLERRLEGKEAEAFAEFMRMGLIDKTQAHDLAGVGETGVEYNPVRHKVMGYISWAFHNAERYNREVTAMAAYRMARESGLEHAAAIKEAAELTWTTHFDYSSGNRARFMQSDTAKVLLVFRQHSVNMLSRLVIDLKDAMKGESAQVKNAAKRRLAGMFSMFGLFAGVMGIPGATAVLALLDLFDDDDDPWSAEDKMKRNLVEALGPDVAAAVLGGVPGTVMDLSLTERIGMGSLWFWSSNREMEGKDAYLYWMEQVLGAAPAMVANTFTGMSMIGEGHVFRGIETMMPKAIKDAMRSGRYAKEGVQTMSGDSLVDEVSTWNVIAQAMGFLPAHIAERYDTNSALRSAEQRIKTERRSILNRYAMAVRQGDGDSRQAMMARIQDFNRRYPQVAITGKTISLSLKARAQRDVRTVGGLALDSRLEFLREGM